MSDRYEQILQAAESILADRENLRTRTHEFRLLVDGKKRRTKAPTMDELSDKSLRTTKSKRGRGGRASRKVQIGPLILTAARIRIIEALKNLGGTATMKEIRAIPGVSAKNASRLLGLMVSDGVIKTTYGDKFRLPDAPSAQNGTH